MKELFLSETFSIFMFIMPSIISLIILYFLDRRLIWLSIPITILFDLLVWGKAIFDSSVNVNIRMYKKWNIIMYKKYLKEPQNPLPNYCLNVAF